MRILAIETSCDDTGIAILEAGNAGNFKVLSNIVSSQTKIHKKYGGVYPAMAKREHQRNLVPVLINALKQAKLLISKSKIQISKQIQNPNFKTIKIILEREPELLKKLIPFLQKYEKPDVDLISVTNGPGLEPCLWVGVNFAKCLSCFWNIPVVPVDHIESHILVNFLENKDIKFPAIALVVSGGHTQIILVKKICKYQILGETRDDAAGECFDKCAKILGLGYPGGPIIAQLTTEARHLHRSPASVKLPRPMISTKDYDFSFSGLKTAVLYAVEKKYGQAPLRSAFSRTSEGRQYIKQMCVEVQQAIIDVLIKKTMKAVRDYKAKTIILGGGVSANSELRKQFARHCEGEARSNLKLIFPKPNLSTDNGLMIAVTGFYHKKNALRYSSGQVANWKEIQADGNLRISK